MRLLERMAENARRLFVLPAQDAAAKGLTPMQVLTKHGMTVLVGLMRMAELDGDNGAEKKEAVMTMVAEFYDTVIAPLDLPGPDMVVDPILRKMVLRTADWAIDSYVAFLKAQNKTP
jgi:hypothetical protein